MSLIRNGLGLLSRQKCTVGITFPKHSFSTSRASFVPQLTLYTGTDCQLCDVAKEVLEDIRKETPFDLYLYNIRNDSLPDVAKWRRAYQYDIPVLHLNGKGESARLKDAESSNLTSLHYPLEIARHRLNKESVLDQIKRASNKE